MKYIRFLLSDIRQNLKFYLLGFSLVASTIAFIPNGLIIYLFGIIYLLTKAYSLKRNSCSMARYYMLFLIACYISVLVSEAWNYRILVFTLIILACTSFWNSYTLFTFREKYLYYCLNVFPILSIGCLFCYYAGINMFVAEEGDIFWDFSAFFPHPMWMGAAVGLGNVVLTWHVMRTKSKLQKLLFGIVLLGSIMITVVSGSRTALFASLAAIIILLFTFSTNIWKFIKIVLIVGVLASATLPFYVSKSGRMMAKFEAGKDQKYGSRTERWETQYAKFKESPISGNGFAVNYYNGYKVIGRSETGSGWLSILFQTGILGAAGMCVIIIPLIKRRKYLKENEKFRLIYCTFSFLCFHSITEGYILTAGYYLCILFWTEIGYILTFPKFNIISSKNENNRICKKENF